MSEQMSDRHGYDGWLNGQAFCLCGSTFPSVDAFSTHMDAVTSVPPTHPPAAPETDVRLTDDERTILTAHFWGRRITANATHLADLIAPAVERIVAERVRVVEGERDAAMAETEMALRMHDVQWSRAESAEAAHRALEAAVEALADTMQRWNDEYEAGTRPTRPTNSVTTASVAARLRALLAGGDR